MNVSSDHHRIVWNTPRCNTIIMNKRAHLWSELLWLPKTYLFTPKQHQVPIVGRCKFVTFTYAHTTHSSNTAANLLPPILTLFFFNFHFWMSSSFNLYKDKSNVCYVFIIHQTKCISEKVYQFIYCNIRYFYLMKKY